MHLGGLLKKSHDTGISFKDLELDNLMSSEMNQQQS